MSKNSLPPLPPGYRWVFRPWRTDPKTGKRIYASSYGLRAWPIAVPE
jgi:hypothetical protein